MKPAHKPLAEQVIVLTGASSGIGLCTAQLAAERGARMVLVARSVAALDSLVERINTGGGQAIYVDADVGDRLQLLDVARTAVARFGRVDTWINNAGVGIYGRLDQVSESDARRLFDTNFWGVVNGCLAALPFLREQGGALINVGSDVSDSVLALQGYCAASKQAVRGFTDALRLEIEQIDQAPISITLVEPRAVNTPFAEHACNYMDRPPALGRPLIEPEEVAQAILQAAVEGGRGITLGQPVGPQTLQPTLVPELGDPGAAGPDRATVQTEGSLFHPSGGGQVHGGTGGARAQSR